MESRASSAAQSGHTSAARPPQTELPAAPPVKAESVPAGRCCDREPPLPSAPPPQAPWAMHCGGGPSPAPWPPSVVQDGATPGAGVPVAAVQSD